jgi:hypothetical protein
MPIINNSFKLNADKKSLYDLLSFLKNELKIQNKVFEYDEFINDNGELNLSFDADEVDILYYLNIFKNKCKDLKVDFNCNLTNWEFGVFYSAYIFRNKSNFFGQYELKHNHFKKAKFKDGTCYFNGKMYEDYDIPLVLCEDMVRHFFGDEIFNFRTDEEKNLTHIKPINNYDSVNKVEKNEVGEFIITFKNDKKLLVMAKDFKNRTLTISEVSQSLKENYPNENMRIPSLIEMNFIDENIFSKGEGNFKKTPYWTSTPHVLSSGLICGTIYCFGIGSDYEGLELPCRIRLVKDIT